VIKRNLSIPFSHFELFTSAVKPSPSRRAATHSCLK